MTIQSSVYRWYRQGTVAVTNGSTAVIGTTTAWTTNVKPGDGFSLDGATWYEVASVTDNTHIVLASNFGGSTTSGASYAIDRRSLAWQVGSEAAARVLALQQMLQQTLKTTGQPPDTIGSDGAVAYDATAMVFYVNTGGVWDTGTSFRGSTVLNGSGAPSSGTGNNADFYLDTTNTRLYGPKTGGAWGSYVSLVGPTGSTGATGATGATGPANSLSIGTVTTGAAGSSASATITGTAPTQTLSLTIPRGDTGATGAGTGDALTSNPLSQFAATTSLQLKGVISDETGSGSLVFATSPTLVTPALGTPSSGTLTNCTGLPNSGVVGLATSTTAGYLVKFSNTTGSQSQSSSLYEDSSNRILVGTTSGSATLHVKGGNTNNLKIDNGGQQYTELDLLNNGTTKAYWYWDNTAGASVIGTIGGGTTFADKVAVGGSISSYTFDVTGTGRFSGALTKGSGTFRIDHPLDPTHKTLIHGFVEAPRYDLLYRGTATLSNGRAIIDIDAASAMTDGTFAALTQTAEVAALHNKSGFARLRSSAVINGEFEIVCEDPTSVDIVHWLVIAERADPFIKSNADAHTDASGHLIPEQDKTT